MRAYRILLGLLAAALAAALVAWAIGTDPGYVYIQRGRLAVETSLVFALLAVGAMVLLAWLALWLLRWPLRAMVARARRRGRRQFARGMLALAEGRPQRAENLLLDAARLRSLRLPALLGALAAVRQRGDATRHGELLQELAGTGEGEVAASVLRAQAELEDGRAGAAIEILTPLDHAQRLPPAGVRALVGALAARGRARESLAMLARLRKAQAYAPAAMDAFEADVLGQALAQCSDAVSLRALWAELSRNQRKASPVAGAFARRAAALGLGDDVADEVEAALKAQWSDRVVEAWARLPTAQRAQRIGRAEAWLKDHPASGGLLLALGRLCREGELWAKAEDYLRRALSNGAGPAAWEELGLLYAAQNDAPRAQRAFANALAATRGEEPGPLGARHGRDDVAAPLPAPDLRNEHGVPVLPPA
ncbi:MAG: heme biosynthesis protein HemY [Xanthomonadaceae bacterium]|nr:heme biosynthesis protein HemY [Xanthomonadaceae bacterium]